MVMELSKLTRLLIQSDGILNVNTITKRFDNIINDTLADVSQLAKRSIDIEKRFSSVTGKKKKVKYFGKTTSKLIQNSIQFNQNDNGCKSLIFNLI